MANERNTSWLLRGALALGCLPLFLPLVGCPADAPNGLPVSLPAQATAPTLTKAQQQTSVGAQQQTVSATAESVRAKKVQATIDQAESSYRSGVENYNNNHLDAARMDFDAAVDGMLSSGLDLKNDSPAANEFERLLNAINSLELLALREGNGFSPSVEDAPLSSTADMTFPSNPELVASLRSQLNTTSDLPLIINDQVAGYINVFAQSTSFRAHMSASLARLGKYRTLIQNTLKEEGVPQDLIYLAVAESGFQPQAVNFKSGAGGMWQFMTYTGPEYGLTRNGYFDYRFDPEKSTRAYARLIKNYHGLFNDWYLAMIAYDWGPGNVQRIVSRTGYSDFWELYRRASMPAETRAYVPQILAAIIMAKNPEKYGLNKLPPSPPVIYDTVTTSYAIDLKLVADLTDSTVAEIVALNPAMLRLVTPRDIAYDLHLPVGTKEAYLDRLKDIPEDDRASWRFHVVKPGETLEQIATSLHAKSTEVAEYNDVTVAQPIATGDELIIPEQAASGASLGVQRYTPRRSDTLITIADRFGVTVEELRAWNHLSANRFTPGKAMYVSEPVRLAPGGRSSRGRARSTTRRSRTGKGATRSSRGASSSIKSAAHGNRSAIRSGSGASPSGSRASRSSSSASHKTSHSATSGPSKSTKKRR